MHVIEQIWSDPLARQYYVSMALIIIPMARILIRAGFKPFWVALLAIPAIGFILCTLLLALRKWPQVKGA